MKKAILILLYISSFYTIAQEFTIKDFEKNYILLDSKKPFSKAKKISFVGVNVTIKSLDYQRKGSLNKMSGDNVNRLISILDGVTYDDLQLLADYFKLTLEKKFEGLGYEIVQPETFSNQEEYQKLLKKETSINAGEIFSQLAAGQEWGGAITFAAGKNPIFKFPKAAFGAHTKLAQKNDVILVNLTVLLEPYNINWDKKFKTSYYDSETYNHTFSYDPVASVSHFSNIFTYNVPMDVVSPQWGALSFEPTAYLAKNKICSNATVNYIKNIKPGAPSGESIQVPVDTFIYTIEVDKDAFLESMKLALSKYTDIFTQYAASKK